MDTIYDYMTPATLAGIVGAARKMMDNGIYDPKQLMIAVEAGKALSANVGEEEAQRLIDNSMEMMD